jgi:hypothetical protein
MRDIRMTQYGQMQPTQQDYIAEFDKQDGTKFWFRNLEITKDKEILRMKFVTTCSNPQFVTLQGVAIKAYIEPTEEEDQTLLEKLVVGDKIEFLSENIEQQEGNDNYFQIINPSNLQIVK